MKKNWIGSCLIILVLALAFAPRGFAQEAEVGTQSGGTLLGLQASTNFEQMMAGLKIQMDNFAITPKMGFFVQHIKDVGTGFTFGLGCGFDYYLKEGSLRPFVGGDLVFYIPHEPGNTDFWVLLSPHIGAEYWLSDSFSLGGNMGIQFGFGESFYTPNTIEIIDGQSDFSFGINGMLQMTYYF